MGSPRKQRRQAHGSAWHWKQTDCWYYTQPGTRQRKPLVDEQGQRIRGKENRQAAEMALARAKVANASGPSNAGDQAVWLVARVCSEYLQYCERGVTQGTISKGHRYNAAIWLNDLCGHCGTLAVAELKKGHIETWVGRHKTWQSSATRRSVLSVVLAAFHHAERQYGAPNPVKGLKKPGSRPRLQSFTPDDEAVLYQATEERFREFLLAATLTGLRPFCELARLTADDVEETDRGMLWRVYSSKTQKTRKIPVRPEVAELTRKLMRTAPRGSGTPLFRNTRGGRWTPSAGVVRFLAIKKKLGWDKDPVKGRYSCYTCRHTFAHRMLSGHWNDGVGCSIETLAELIGDTPKVAFDHYGREWGQHYQAPLWAAIGAGSRGGAAGGVGRVESAKKRAGKAKRGSPPRSAATKTKARTRR
jgi:integrase